MKTPSVLFLCLLTVSVFAEDYESELYNDNLKSAFELIKQKSPDITDDTNITDWNVMGVGSNFDCTFYKHEEEPQTVHELTPYDIKVVGSLGDSITAAMGAKASTLLDDLIEYREVSWSIGGDKDLSQVTTLPNIIRMYNSNIKGYSTKVPLLPIRNKNNNVAVSGAIAQDMPAQAKTLVDKIKSDSSVNMDDWKLITLWIGGNNLCSCCKKDKIEKHSTANYITGIREALDILHEELPRTFVNLVQIIDVTRLDPLQSIVCSITHGLVCSCASNGTYTSQVSTNYQEAVSDLIASQRYNDRDDFTVVVQPFYIGVELPMIGDKPDKSYFAPDCFHFSAKGHKEAAVGLWNNMLQPVGEKTTGWDVGGKINCPSEKAPYFFTEKNSVQQVSGVSAAQQSDNKKSGHYVAIATGSTIGVCLLAVFAVLAIVVPVVYKRRRQLRNPEQIQLLN